MPTLRSLSPALAGLLVALAVRSQAAAFTEDFSTEPATRGWKVFGDTNLFVWNATNQDLQVKWDSSQTNSYFYRPLGTVLAGDDDFGLEFDLRLDDIAIGVDTNKPYTFQVAVGFLHVVSATRTNFLRGTGYDSPNLVEFDYFPDSGFGATVSTPLISSNNEFATGGFTFPLELVTNVLYRVTMSFTAVDHTLRATLSSNGVPVGPIQDSVLGTNFSDFRLDAVAVSSYSDAGQFPGYAGSILANGVVDNFLVTTPPPPVQNLAGHFTNDVWQAQFLSRSNWLYTLERTEDLQSWAAVSPATSGNGAALTLQDAGPQATNGFYRVSAQRP